ncbi:alanine--glyoxylate aminotransferase family protein [Candidatus Borrarchaeum sp.]|uniref:pyridoxal-phosphate-dependent aminotransferase family protein n=1 Tax=Candidatus Borrarchaeum sp. TaxID=2846742 RepID=UPI00257A7AD6|nr:alanine--glyoxylate aminotransferase family protein [Candidatus Borrarchaeum sp.]
MRNRKILMIPGPSEAHPDVLNVLSQPVMPHYGNEWGDIYEDTCQQLKKIFNTKQSVIILAGPGGLGLELSVANLIEPGDKAIVVHNGFFGELYGRVVELYESMPVVTTRNYGEAADVNSIKEKCEQEDIKAIFLVHNETSTAVANPVKEIGEIAKKNGILYAVDAISSFGGMELRCDDWNIDVCVGYASKALGSIMGVTPVMLSEKTWEVAKNRKQPIRGRYLNLNVWEEYIEELTEIGHPFPASVPTSVVLALRKAIELALEEGLENRYKRHAISAKAVRAGIRALGLQCLPKEEIASDTVTAFRLPDELNEDEVRRIINGKYNIMVSLMKNLIGLNGIRIGHMGVTASQFYVIPTLAALEQTLSSLGFKTKPGSAVIAAMEVYGQHNAIQQAK